MDIDDNLKEITETLLKKLGADYKKVIVSEDEKDNFSINIECENPSLMIGHHGENIQALQHLVKVISWNQCKTEHFNILLDIDEYRKRQEENILKMAQRKVENARRTGRPQTMPPMSPYFRRKVHMYCMGAGFEDIETLSQGDGDVRHIIIKLKN